MDSDVVQSSLVAILTGVAAIITAYASLLRARKQGNEDCQEKLKAARIEAEEAMSTLHERIMKEES